VLWKSPTGEVSFVCALNRVAPVAQKETAGDAGTEAESECEDALRLLSLKVESRSMS
jgi:hypothetical protein